jgi:hypothetical protein
MRSKHGLTPQIGLVKLRITKGGPEARTGRPREMTTTSESGAVPDDPPTPIERPTPKRGAFPTPKSEIEKAKPYIPDIGEFDDCSEQTPDPLTDADSEREG